MEEFKEAAGTTGVIHKSEKETLLHRWRYPSLSLHGIEGAFSDPGCKTVIPRTVIGKFSIRLVPNMMPEQVEDCCRRHLQEEFRRIKSPHTFKLTNAHGAPAFLADPEHVNYQAAAAAVKTAWGVDPDFTRDGGSIPVTLTFQETGKNVLLLPFGRGDDGAHSQNEKLDKTNMMGGIKMMAAYLFEVAKRTAK